MKKAEVGAVKGPWAQFATGGRSAAPGGAERHAEAEPEAKLPEPPAAALVPAEILQPGEAVILMLKPSPWFIFLAPLRPLLMMAVMLGIAFYLTPFETPGIPGLGRRDIAVLFLVLLSVRLFWQFLEWLNRLYVLTDRRVIRVKGVVRVQVFEAALKQVQNTEVLFSARERVFGLGTIAFATASGAQFYWDMIALPLETHQTVVKALHRYR